ncbi:MAG: YesL family protein [Clostridia bacterium]|nr:YesL family protein [Clostridia bacterium]
MQIFHPDSKFSQFIYNVTDYVKLGLTFLLFIIPGITAGAAAAAVMTVGMRIEWKKAPTIFRPFWQAFKDNFRQGTTLTLLFMAAFGFLAADWYVLWQMEETALIRLICGLVFVLALLVGCLALWVFPTLARTRKWPPWAIRAWRTESASPCAAARTMWKPTWAPIPSLAAIGTISSPGSPPPRRRNTPGKRPWRFMKPTSGPTAMCTAAAAAAINSWPASKTPAPGTAPRLS